METGVRSLRNDDHHLWRNGSTVSAWHGEGAREKNDLRFPAIKLVHAKGLLVSREALHLCRGGYPDGALARWRTLHELAVTAMFLSKHTNEEAFRFIASFDFKARTAARQINRYAERANLQPFSEDELAGFAARVDVHTKLVGQPLDRDYEWARTALALSGRTPVTLLHLEENVGLDHWRPRYRWASQHTHSGHRPLHGLLGMAEASEMALLIGPSNSGMVDPLAMTALSLAILDSAFFSLNPDTDSVVAISMQAKLAAEIGPLAVRIERASLAKARKTTEADAEAQSA